MSELYSAARQKFLTGALDWLTDDFKVALLGDTYVFSDFHENFDDLTGVLATSGSLVNTSASLGVADADDIGFAGYILSEDIYVGGEFTSIAGNTRNRVASYNTSGSLASFSPNVNGTIYATLPDASGGVYIGGSFTSVDGQTRNRLAYINSSGSLTNWNPSADGTVRSFAKIGVNIYIGGDFTSVSSTTRNRLAGVSQTGTLLNWNPNANGNVHSLCGSGSNIYIGGAFTNVSSSLRNYSAAVNTSGSLLTWDPDTNANVDAIVSINENIYIGGQFTSVSAGSVSPAPRNYAAAFNTAGTLLSWDLNASGAVKTFSVFGDNIYVGGSFTAINTSTRNHLAAVNTAGSLLSWDPNTNGTVYSLTRINQNIYIGGSFTNVSNSARNYLAAVNTSGTLLAWDPNASANVFAMATPELSVNYVVVYHDSGTPSTSTLIAYYDTDTVGELIDASTLGGVVAVYWSNGPLKMFRL